MYCDMCMNSICKENHPPSHTFAECQLCKLCGWACIRNENWGSPWRTFYLKYDKIYYYPSNTSPWYIGSKIDRYETEYSLNRLLLREQDKVIELDLNEYEKYKSKEMEIDINSHTNYMLINKDGKPINLRCIYGPSQCGSMSYWIPWTKFCECDQSHPNNTIKSIVPYLQGNGYYFNLTGIGPIIKDFAERWNEWINNANDETWTNFIFTNIMSKIPDNKLMVKLDTAYDIHVTI